MDMNELQGKDVKALTEELNGKQKELMSLRFQLASQELTNTSLLAKTRKDIARLKTVINQKRNNLS